MPNLVRRPALLLVAALVSLGAVVTLLGRLAGGPKAEPKRTLLAAGAGVQTYPAFSPDGRRIAYSARQESDDSPFHLMVRPASGGAARALTAAPAGDVGPAWSPDGSQIAFLRLAEGGAQYLSIPADGGSERKIAEFANSRDDSQPLPAVSWTRDGKSLIVVDTSASPPALAAVAMAGGAITPITHPPEGSGGDSTPAVSPDGATLAFVRAGAEGADIYLCDLHGDSLRRLTFDDTAIRGLAWTPDGRDVVYAATRAGDGSQLFRISAYGGSPRLVAAAGTHANFPAISATGHRLAYADNPAPVAIWRARLQPDGEATDAHEFIRSTGRDSWPSYSPDGKRIVFISDRTGADEIWLSDAEGAKPVQSTRFLDWPRLSQPRWSPDGRSLLFSYAGSLGRGLFLVNQGDPQPELVALGGANGSWSHDGKQIYFDAEGRVWRTGASGGKREAVTSELGTAQAVESPDGKYVYFRRRRSVWRVPAAGVGEARAEAGDGAEQVFTPEFAFWSGLQPFGDGVYYLGFQFGARRAAVSFFDFASKQSSEVLRLRGREPGAAFSYAVSPDRRYILYPQTDRAETNLMLLENFR